MYKNQKNCLTSEQSVNKVKRWKKNLKMTNLLLPVRNNFKLPQLFIFIYYTFMQHSWFWLAGKNEYKQVFIV